MTLAGVHFDGRVLLLLLLIGLAFSALLIWALPADHRDRENEEAVDRSFDNHDA